jgi:lipopolysaccharide/colanic/teichoic acid biosynthesis glycosyltransferase
MVRLDRYYLEKWSVWLDFGNYPEDEYVVATRKGAY